MTGVAVTAAAVTIIIHDRIQGREFGDMVRRRCRPTRSRYAAFHRA
jgi:hypothetical protein